MMMIRRRLHTVFAFSAGMTVLVLGPSPARAQFNLGWFWGGFNQPSAATTFLNERANIQAARGPQAPISHNPLAGNPNAYFNRVRDNGIVPRFDVTRRRPPSYRPAAVASRGNAGQVQPQPAAATTTPTSRPVSALARFFDASQRLVWPNDAPRDGDLGAKRDLSDQASLALLVEAQRQGTASISTATYARQKLLNYGQPALQEVRTNATPQIAETFHYFLLSLYDALAQAASMP